MMGMTNEFDSVDEAYKSLLEEILDNGILKENRTGVKTLSVFGAHYQVDLQKGFPLLTLKRMDGGIWNSMVTELLWYLSGEHHIKNLKKETSIWNEWADEDDNLTFAYGRFWRRFPVPNLHDRAPGEAWAIGDQESMKKFVREEKSMVDDRHVLVFDQIAYILDCLENKPFSRRMVLTAHHPANGALANPPACHCMAIFNVAPDDEGNPDLLSCHLTMRSNDVGLGHPFNVAQYAMLTHVLAKLSGLRPGKLAYTGTDAHLYIGEGDQAKYDQRKYAKTLLEREAYESPTFVFKGNNINTLHKSQFKLKSYESHPHVGMKVVP